MRRHFLIHCQRPALGVWGNKFMRAADLGVEGAYVPSNLVVSFTTKPGYTTKRFREHLNKGLESQECHDIAITELTEEQYQQWVKTEKVVH
jgi:hypothetical protein